MKEIFINDFNENIDLVVTRVKALLINSKNEILLEENNNTYQFPGGHLKDNETIEECLQREIKEETGIDLTINSKPFLKITCFYKNYFNTGKNVKSIIYYYDIYSDKMPNFEETNYDDLEIQTDFNLLYLRLKDLKSFLIQSKEDGTTNENIANEMLLALDTYLTRKEKKMKILVTGGLGFIGSHTCVELLNNNYEVVVIDNLSNSKIDVVDKIKTITNKSLTFYNEDVCNEEKLEEIFSKEKIDAVIHFAGYKAVGESVKEPIMYYENNLISTLKLLKVMKKYNCKNFVFSSSATVYGSPKSLPIKEDFPLKTTNPYGTTKLMIENILKDLEASDKDFSIAILRYFNPIGAHKSGLLGENPKGIPNNLMPYIVRVANKELDILSIFGNDYDTVDGTGVRDYIHVVDLAKGHLKAIEKVARDKGLFTYNLGTGKGYSVLELVNTFMKVNNVDVPYKIVDRRPGDIASCYADATKAYEELGWKAELGIEEMCRDAYNFIKTNK